MTTGNLGGAPGPVRQLDHARWLGAAGVDAKQATAAELGEPIELEDLDPEPRRLADFGGQGGQAGRREMAGRRVGEVAGEHRRTGRRAATSDAGLDGTLPVDRGQQRQRLQGRGVAVGLQRVEAVAGEQDALDDGLGGGGSFASRLVHTRRQGGVLGHGTGECSSGVAQLGERQRALAGPDGDEVGAVATRDDERLTGLALEPEGGERRPVDAELARHRALLPYRNADRSDRGRGAAGDRDGEVGSTAPRRRGVEPAEVAADPGQRPTAGGEGIGLQ